MNSVSGFCNELGPVLRLVGIVVKGIRCTNYFNRYWYDRFY